MSGKPSASAGIKAKVVAQNRKAFHDYFVEETFEAGIMLTGTEVKSLRLGKASLSDSFVDEVGGELFLLHTHIPEYTKGNRFNHEPRRPRKLLMHRRQINKLIGLIRQKGMTIVPLSIYFNPKNIAKVEIALVKGKKQHDKREATKERDWKREQGRALKSQT